MSDNSANSWPEQDAIWAWMKRQGITLTFEQERDLKDAVTAARVEVTRALTEENQARRAYAIKLERALPAHEPANMTDLEKRLRDRHDSLYGKGSTPSVMTEAADELANLKAQIDAANTALGAIKVENVKLGWRITEHTGLAEIDRQLGIMATDRDVGNRLEAFDKAREIAASKGGKDG